MSFVPNAPEEQKTTRPGPGIRETAAKKRTIGEDPVPAPTHSTANLPRNFREINGWGADLDPANRPSVPREYPTDVMTVRGDVKHWQEPRVKIYVSNEQPGITPVFGESCPPHGLSGLLRDYAYQFGEATNRHWLTLMLADRVDIFESFIVDTLTGQYVKEKGWTAKMKYRDDAPDTTRRLVTAGAVVIGALAIGLMIRNSIREE